jgi:hypothetical protein
VSREEYEAPGEQIMVILGFKHGPKCDTVLHAPARCRILRVIAKDFSKRYPGGRFHPGANRHTTLCRIVLDDTDGPSPDTYRA